MPDVHICEIVKIEKFPGKSLCGDRLSDYVACSIVVSCPEIAKEARAGQFVHIKCDESLVLRRPFGICSVSGDEVRFVFEVKGDGTRLLLERKPGDLLDILGPLGNGFNIPDGGVIVAGGGLGTPPMLFAAESAAGNVAAVLGFRDSGRVMLTSEFEAVCDKVYLTTDDGSAGLHGLVTNPLEELLKTGMYSCVLSCGQYAMLSAVAKLCESYKVPCQVSLEERMGCGVGACLVCACATREDGVEKMSRVCRDGPVFDAGDVVWKV